jgi:hypothetical protein
VWLNNLIVVVLTLQHRSIAMHLRVVFHLTTNAVQIISAMLLTTQWLNAHLRTSVYHKIRKSSASHLTIMVVRQTQNISTNVQETVDAQKATQIVQVPEYVHLVTLPVPTTHVYQVLHNFHCVARYQPAQVKLILEVDALMG